MNPKARISSSQRDSKLDLTDQNLKDFPDNELILRRDKLTKLVLRNNSISGLSSSITTLTRLESFDISWNNIQYVDSLCTPTLSQLTRLNLEHNNISIIPDSIALLSSLTRINLANNKIRDISASFYKLKNLQKVFLFQNEITELSEEIGKLKEITQFNIHSNRLKKLPIAICTLEKLKSLDLTKNDLRVLPLQICQLKNLEELRIRDNPKLEIPPLEFQREDDGDARRVKDYLEAAVSGTVTWKRMKLVLCGNGGAGKTTILRSIENQRQFWFFQKKLIEDPQSTVGIDMYSWEWDNIHYSVWDFAGQIEYSTLHQFFMSSRNAVYLVVVDCSQSADEIERQVDYWIQYIKPHLNFKEFSPKSTCQLIVVGTQIDKDKARMNFQLLESQWANLKKTNRISDWVRVSAQQGLNIKELMEKIRSFGNLIMKSHPSAYNIPKFYATVYDKLREVSANTLLVHRSQLVELCDHSLTETCLTYLHNIGTIIYQKSSQMICCYPNVLIRLLSCFICQSDSHKTTLFGSTHIKKRINSSIVRKNELQEELKNYIQHLNSQLSQQPQQDQQPPPLLSLDNVDVILTMLENFGLFYRLKPEAEKLYRCEGYIFPSLRDKGTFKLIDFGALIRYAAASSQEIQKTLEDSKVDLNSLLYQNQYGGFDNKEGKSIENSEKITFQPQLTIACRIQFRDQRVRSPHFFFQFQIQTKEAHDIKSHLYSNGFRINDKYGNHAVIIHDPKSRDSIDVVIQGFTPLSLLMEIKKELLMLYEKFYLHSFPVIRNQAISDNNNNNNNVIQQPEANLVQANLVLEIENRAKDEEQLHAVKQMLDFDENSPFMSIYVCPACIIRLSPGEIDYLHPEFVDCHSFGYDIVHDILFGPSKNLSPNQNLPAQPLTQTRICMHQHQVKVHELVWGYFDAEFVINTFRPLMHTSHIMNRPYSPHYSSPSYPSLYPAWEANLSTSLFEQLLQKEYNVWYKHITAAVMAQPLNLSIPVDSSNTLVLGPQPGPAYTRVPVPKTGLHADEFEEVQKWFKLGLQNTHEHYVHFRIKNNFHPISFELQSAERVINPTLFINFQKKFHELKSIGRHGEELKIQRFFHATPEKNLNSVCEIGLLPYNHIHNPNNLQNQVKTDGGWFGDTSKGIYLSRFAEYTFHYARSKPLRKDETVKILLCLTLPGRTNHILKTTTLLSPTEGYDSHYSPRKIEVFLFDSSQCCPMYILEIKAVKATVTADDGVVNPHVQYTDSDDDQETDPIPT